MNIENIQIYGFSTAIRALRNPMDSWNKSDSINSCYCLTNINRKNINNEGFILGKQDKLLSQKLTNAGNEHCKHLRMIQTWMDLTLPRYMWQEFDTYGYIPKISCSTMHKLTSYILDNSFFEYPLDLSDIMQLNSLIYEYNKTKDIKDFYKLKNRLPEGLLQKRTVNVNYQSWLNIYNQRKSHKLEQWHTICDMILKLPYFVELTGIEFEEDTNG